MWYNVDFSRLAAQLLPPMLRSPFLCALLQVLLVPLRHTYGVFRQMKSRVDDRLCITANVQYLERALNTAFCLSGRQIYIDTPDVVPQTPWHFQSERQEPVHLHFQGGNAVTLNFRAENSEQVNFVVMVPASLLATADGTYIRSTIGTILNIYKPAGRTFSIAFYET